MKISIVLGTRPEIIKMSPVIRECKRLGLDYFILHTGQHYSYNMDKVFFEDLELPDARYNLDVGSDSHGEQTGKMLIEIEKVLQKEKPDVVLVEGDTNSTLAGALAATKLGMKVGHVEAGLRSYDRRMPEEVNRVLTDHCSDYLFAPTEKSREILIGEGISEEKIFVTGNTVVDAVYQNLEISNRKRNVINDLHLQPREYFVVTAHRQENVDDKERFSGILSGLKKVGSEFGIPIVYPIHPRSRKQMKEFGLQPDEVRLVDPVDFLSFLQLENNAKLVLSDSGGVQEEACVFGVPCVTLRDNTERPETVEVGSNVLAGIDSHKILECVKMMVLKRNGWENPFGDGNAGRKIVEALRRNDLFGARARAPNRRGMLKTGEGKPLKPFIVAAIPAYNEEKTIARVVLQAQRFVDKVMICDDGSSDLTAEIAERLGADVMRHGRNMGKGAAFKSLFGRALELNADVMVTLDGDGQHDPDEIPHLVKPILSGDADITVGSRFLAGNNEMPLYRQFGSRVLNGLVNVFGAEKVSDTQSGFRAYNRKALKEIDIASEGIGVDSEILLKAYCNDVKIKEVPVSCRFKGVKGSTYNPVRHGVNVVGSIIRYGSERRPLLTFGLPGAVVLAAGLMLFIYVLQIYFLTKQFAVGYMLTSMIAILAGVFSIFTAIILYTVANLMDKLEKSREKTSRNQKSDA